MRNYVIINGVNSLTIQGLAINNLPPITKPMIRTQREEIDGRDGDIVTELGYSAYDKQMEIGLYGNFDIDAIIKYFTGEGTIVFSNEADKYYNFKILDQIDYEKLLKFKTAVVTFHCQPFKYPLEEEPVEAEITTITGTGENITLEDIEEAPMKIVYKGNTYQYSTTGKNLLNIVGTKTENGVTSTGTSDGKIISTGTCTATYFTMTNNIDISLPAGTYTFSIDKTLSFGIVLRCIYPVSTQTNHRIQAGNTNVTFTISKNASQLRVYAEGNITSGTSINATIYPMLESGSSATSFEPYTNGASPNPSYPQDIHTVSGDNEIVVTGKNLYNNRFSDYTRPLDYLIHPITLEQGKAYTLKATLTGTKISGIVVGIVPTGEKYAEFSTRMYIAINSGGNVEAKRTITIDETWTSPKLIVYCPPSSLQTTFENIFENYEIQLEKGLTATDYEPYQGASYPVNLPVENILDITSSGSSIGGVPFTIENGIIKINGTTSSSTASYYFNTFRTKSESAMFSIEVTGYTDKSSGNSALILQQSDDGTTGWSTLSELSLNSVYAKQNSVTLDSSKYYRLRWFVDNNTFTNATIKAQLEYGNKKNSFTPYGTTPIELCKIGTYQDSIKKSTGKNLFNANEVQIGMAWNNTNNSARAVIIIPVEQNIAYTISMSGNNSMEGIYVSYSAKTLAENATNGVGLSLITSFPRTYTSSTEYIILQFNKSSISLSDIENLKLQVEKGTTALTYEPYGKVWYVNKQIGKVVLDGSETGWSNLSMGANYKRTDVLLPYTPMNIGSRVYCLSNYFLYNNSYNTDTIGSCFISTIDNKIYVYPEQQDTLENFKTWLSTHNTEVYYVLATPTYTLIEGELLNQLEAIKMSYEGQTNISQTNNDLPLELDASVTFLTPMEINNIGNIYAKPILTIEGTGNIGVILNGIQILEIDLSNNGKITIDVPKLEAYDPDDDSLLNRLVTGDYMKLLINEGDNKITFTGEVSGATLTNYIRWI